MIVAVGSLRKSKQEAVRKAFAHYYTGFTVAGVDCDSGVPRQPLREDEIIRGAINRAKCALKRGDVGVGIEGGLRPLAGANSGYIETTWCAIADKDGVTIGAAPSFEYPKKLVDAALAGKEISLSGAKLLDVPERELKEIGVVGELTKKAMPRSDYMYCAVLMALVPRIRKELF